MTITATKCKGRDLKPGDLFSTADQAYWSNIERQQSVGERVYIRTNMPADQFLDADEDIYRITINHTDKEAAEPFPMPMANYACNNALCHILGEHSRGCLSSHGMA